MKRNIAVLYGGYSSEYEISVKSSRQIIKWLDKNRYNVFPVIVTKKGFFYPDENGTKINLNDFSVECNSKKHNLHFAYIIIHGSPGENGLLTGYLEMLGIPHSTCPSLVSALTFNKYFCKLALQNLPVNLAKSILLRKNDVVDKEEIIEKLGLPIFVKPNNGGSSCGTSKVKSVNEFDEALKIAFSEDNEITIEEFIQGTEVSCGVVKTKAFSALLPITEIISKKEFFDYEAKYTPGMSEEITPARIPENVYKLCHDFTSRIYDFLGCKGVVRIDYIIKNQQPYFLEINTIPGMSEASIVPQQAAHYGISMTELLSYIIEEHF